MIIVTAGVASLISSSLRIFSFSDILFIVGIACVGLALILLSGVGCAQCMECSSRKSFKKPKIKKIEPVKTKLDNFLKELEVELGSKLAFSKLSEEKVLRIQDAAEKVYFRNKKKKALGEIPEEFLIECHQLCSEIIEKKLVKSEEILEAISSLEIFNKLKEKREPKLKTPEAILKDLEKELKSLKAAESTIDSQRVWDIRKKVREIWMDARLKKTAYVKQAQKVYDIAGELCDRLEA